MKSVLLIGLGRFGKHIAMKLNELDHEVMAIDINEERVNAILPFVTNAQIGDSTNKEFLSSLGIGNFNACIDFVPIPTFCNCFFTSRCTLFGFFLASFTAAATAGLKHR